VGQQRCPRSGNFQGAALFPYPVRRVRRQGLADRFHILYGGSDGKVWRIGHVRTRDFRNFEPNPHNPIFTPSLDRSAWDCDGILTPQVFEAGDFYYMLYAGKKDKEWQTGLAKTRKP
jgi:predicted GH43/DUF377 family glycosyl hydrolase